MLIEFLLIEFEKLLSKRHKHLYSDPGFLFPLEKFNKLPSLTKKSNTKLYALQSRVTLYFFCIYIAFTNVLQIL
jgi:hypothetical protein